MILFLLFVGCKEKETQVNISVEDIQEVEYCDEDCIIENEIQAVIDLVNKYGPLDLNDKAYENLVDDIFINKIVVDSL